MVTLQVPGVNEEISQLDFPSQRVDHWLCVVLHPGCMPTLDMQTLQSAPGIAR
jgi:hypothetical protein